MSTLTKFRCLYFLYKILPSSNAPPYFSFLYHNLFSLKRYTLTSTHINIKLWLYNSTESLVWWYSCKRLKQPTSVHMLSNVERAQQKLTLSWVFDPLKWRVVITKSQRLESFLRHCSKFGHWKAEAAFLLWPAYAWWL